MELKNFFLKYSIASCIFYIVMSSFIIKYITELEKKNCECSNYWYRDFIKYYTCVIVIIVMLYAFNQTHFLKTLQSSNLALFFMAIIKFISLIYFGVIIFYFMKLKNSDCKCSKNWKRKSLLYPIIIFSLGMLVFIFFMMKNTISYLV